MNRSVINAAIAIAICFAVNMWQVGLARADLIIDDFEASLIPSGDPIGYFSFGTQLSDRGVSNAFGSTSGTNSAFYVINFNLDPGFGVGAAHQGLSLALDPNSEATVNVRIQQGPVSGGFIAFRLEDTDGTIIRTATSQLHAATSSFTNIRQTLSTINHVDEAGTTAGLNWAQINSVGLLFFDQGFAGTTTVVFDDLIIAVPEPSSAVLVSMCVLCWAVRRRGSRNRLGK